MIEAINSVFSAVCGTFRVEVRHIGTYAKLGYPVDAESFMLAHEGRIAYNPNKVGPETGGIVLPLLELLGHTSAATKSAEGLAAHEIAHVLEDSGRTSLSAPLGKARSNRKVRQIVIAFRSRIGERSIRAELGDRAWEGDPRRPGEEWHETWAEAFSAYWIDQKTLSLKARRMVEEVLESLFPDLEGQ